MKENIQQLPTEDLLKCIVNFAIERNNYKSERYRFIYVCLFLLCWKSGLRANEAIAFDLKLRHPRAEFKHLFLLRGKRNKKRYVYVSDNVLKNLEKFNWKPNLVNRIGFWAFLKKIKMDMKIDISVELTPHTLRRCFATYNLLAGMPLNIVKEYLGHSRISTTALYVRDTNIANLLRFKPI